MAGENINNSHDGAAEASEWDSLTNYAGIEEKTERIHGKIDDYVARGIISAEHAESMKAQREKMATAERAESDSYEAKLAAMAKRAGGEEGFAGEQNLNSRTGKERTKSIFDLYPKMQGETNEAYGARLRRMRELTEKYEAEENGKLGGEESEDFNGDEQARLEEAEKKRLEEEEKRRLEEEERRRLEAEEGDPFAERDRLKKEEAETEEQIKKIKEELAALGDGPLVAVNADFTHDKKELAHDLAEQDLNAEMSKSGIIKRLWKGTLFRKYFEKKYEKEYLAGDRERDGKNIHELVEERSGSAMSRFVLGAVEDMRFVHDKAGESLEEADAETSEKVRLAIEKFATAKIPEGKTLEDLKLQFMEEMGRAGAEADDQGKKVDKNLINNYLEVAIQARTRAEHGIAIESVMEGFKVYNAEVRDGVRTEAHRDSIDKITNWIENSKIGQFIPAEIIAGATGLAFAFTQTGARAVVGVAGGMLASSAISGLKERNRITEDRARMLRDAANGLEYAGMDEEAMKDLKGRAKKIAKYEKRIGGTLYDLQPASSLTSSIEAAMAMEQGEERDKALMAAITEARVRIDFSDSEQKDLISYSSEAERGAERLALDQILIRAEKSLSEKDASSLEGLKAHLTSEIEGDIDEKDKDFKRTRTLLAMKKAGKTLAIGAATFFVSQEVMAAFDPGKIGIFEKAGLLKTDNVEGASETLIASGFGLNRGMQVTNISEVRVSGDNEVTMEQLEQAGYQKTELSAGFTTSKNELVEIDPTASDSALRVKWNWANNGTTVSDGNELRVFNGDGSLISGMRGVSTMGSETFDYAALASEGKITGIINIGGANFEVASTVDSAGRLVFGENGIFTTTSGETIRAIGENGEKLYKYFSVAVDRGINADGVKEVVSLATDVGRDSFSGTMSKVISTTIEHPAEYLFTKTTETVRDITAAGLAFAPETARTGLGEAGVTGASNDGEIIDIYTVGGTGSGATREVPGATNPPITLEGFGSWWDTLSEEEKARVRSRIGGE